MCDWALALPSALSSPLTDRASRDTSGARPAPLQQENKMKTMDCKYREPQIGQDEFKYQNFKK